MLTFDDYKAKISIIQILEDLGYKQDISKGKVSPVFKLTDGAGNKLDEIIIKNPHSVQEHYYDRNYKGGDLIQFIKNHINDFPQFQHQNTFVRINMILGHYANEPYSPKYEAFKVVKAENKSFDRDRYKEFPTTLADLRFLTNERNINHQVVEKFLPFITRVKDLQGNGNYYNIGFPYINPKDKDNKVTNYELRNYGFKGMAAGGDKSNSLWIADFCPHPQMAKHIYFAESALDAMSFYQLNANKIKLEESVFCSVGGYISVNQIKNTLLRYPQQPQSMQPIVIQCDLPQAMNKLTAQADGINWELEEIRKTLPELKTRIDLTSVQKSLTEMQKSLTEMNKLLERVGNLSEKYSCKWIRWLPDFSLLVALKWIALLLVIGAAAMAGWYGVVAIRSLFP